ncbi:hypothetical protein CBM2606_A90124 [Cupriavidus taiwanensis]|nr:hypothetical protein CBM2606_A90124 [Cupriavidus taiwanensis]
MLEAAGRILASAFQIPACVLPLPLSGEGWGEGREHLRSAGRRYCRRRPSPPPLSRKRERGANRRTASGSAFRFIPSLKSHPPLADNFPIPPRRPSPRQSHQSRTRAPCLSSVLASPA